MGLGDERLDVLVVGKALDEQESRERKIELDRIAAMLSRLGGRGYRVKEDSPPIESQKPISIPIAISIPMKSNPNKRMHWTLILRASDP